MLGSQLLQSAGLSKYYATFSGDVDLVVDSATLLNAGKPGTDASAAQTGRATRFIYVGVTGDINLILADNQGTAQLFAAVPAGTTLWVQATKIVQSTTTATKVTVGW